MAKHGYGNDYISSAIAFSAHWTAVTDDLEDNKHKQRWWYGALIGALRVPRPNKRNTKSGKVWHHKKPTTRTLHQDSCPHIFEAEMS